MRKSHQAAAYLIFGALVGVLAWKQLDTAEPHYRGKPLSYWVLLNARSTSEPPVNPAVAIAEMGTNATPYLVKWMSRTPYNWQRRLRVYRNGNSILHRCIPYWATGIDKENRAMAALAAIQCLGPAGRSAIPTLVPLAINPTNYSAADFATRALCKMGEEALPALLIVATNRQARSRWLAINYLGELRIPGALPTLIKLVDDPSPTISGAAARALGELEQRQ